MDEIKEIEIPKLELAFKNQEFSGIVMRKFLIEDGEVVEYIKKLKTRVRELEYQVKNLRRRYNQAIIDDVVLKEIEDYLFWCKREISNDPIPTIAGKIYIEHIECLLSKNKDLESKLSKIKSDPIIGKLEIEEWLESPDY